MMRYSLGMELREALESGDDFSLYGLLFQCYGKGVRDGECYQARCGFDDHLDIDRYIVEVGMDGLVHAYDTLQENSIVYEPDPHDPKHPPYSIEALRSACKRVAQRGNFPLPKPEADTLTEA